MKKTVGHHALELQQKTPDTQDPIELQREMHTDYDDNIQMCIGRGQKDMDGDFFVVVETKKERLMPNVLRNYFFYRHSCPTPTTDQTVYKYHADDNRIEFLWVVPSKDTCLLMKQNALHVPPEEKELLKFVLDYSDGTLLQRAKKENKEIHV